MAPPVPFLEHGILTRTGCIPSLKIAHTSLSKIIYQSDQVVREEHWRSFDSFPLLGVTHPNHIQTVN